MHNAGLCFFLQVEQEDMLPLDKEAADFARREAQTDMRRLEVSSIRRGYQRKDMATGRSAREPALLYSLSLA